MKPGHQGPRAGTRAPLARLLRPASLTAIAGLGALCALYQVRDYDTFFHLAAGRFIVAQGEVPSVDPFSFTFRGEPWRNHSPLAQVLFHAVERAGGFEGLSLFNAFLTALLTALPLWSLRSLRLNPRFGIGLSVLGPVAFREVLAARPHLLGYLALQLCCLALARDIRGAGLRAVWWLPVLYALWLQTHGSHLLLPLLLLTLAAVRALQRQAGDALRALAVAVPCLVLLALLSPDAIAQGAGHVGNAALATIVPEWQPLQPALLLTPAGLAFLGIWLLTLLGLALARSPSVRGETARSVSDPAWIALVAVLMVVALTSVRMLPLFMIGAAPLWLPAACLALGRVLAGFERRLPRVQRPLLALLPAAALTLLALVLSPTGARFGWGLDRARVPVGAVDYLAAHPRIARVYNAYNYGGYLMYRGVPEAGVFIDGRAITLYPPAFLQAFDAAYDDPRHFEALARMYRVDGVLMPLDSERTPRLIAHLQRHPAWTTAYRDAQSVLFAVAPAP